MKKRMFAVALSLIAVLSGRASAQDITPWNWKLTIYDASNYEIETKEFTSRSAAEQYLWAYSPVHATLRDVKYIKRGVGAEYLYTGTRFPTAPGKYQYEVDIDQTDSSVRWYNSEGEATAKWEAFIKHRYGTSRKACDPIIDKENWDADLPDPFGHEIRRASIKIFMDNDPTCRPNWPDPQINVIWIEKSRITDHDWVENVDGNYFADPPPFTGLFTNEILHDGPIGAPYGQYTENQWSVFSRHTAKLVGQPNHCSPIKGNPCDIARGSKQETAMDASGYGPLSLVRTYNSTDIGGSFGRGWRGPFDYVLMRSSDGSEFVLATPNGKMVDLSRSAGEFNSAQRYRSADNRSVTATRYYTPLGDRQVRVEFPGMWMEFRDPTLGGSTKPLTITYGGDQEVRLGYDAQDRLDRAEHRGRSVKFIYENTGTELLHKVSAALMPDGRLIMYEYKPDGNLDRVADDSGEMFKYGYKAGTSLITSILESGEHPREYQYDDLRRLIESTNGPAKYAYAYQPTRTTVTYPGGRVEVTDFESTILRRPVREETVGGLISTTTYTGYGDTITETDNTGLTTIRKYNHNSETFHTLLNNELLRTVVTTVEPGTSRPLKIAEMDGTSTLVAQTDYVYNARKQVTSVTRKDAKTGEQRTSTLTYCEDVDLSAPDSTCATLGTLKSSDGPRTDVGDVTAYDYYVSDAPGCAAPGGYCPYRRGDLWKVRQPLGQTLEFLAYDDAGRVLGSKDANGIVTHLEYDPRGRLAAQKVRGADDTVETDDRITRFEYTPSGSVSKITLPDRTYTRFTYDTALRLTDITDNGGDVIHFTLDNTGNAKQEDVKAGGATIRRTLSRAYNALGQLEALKDASQNATAFRYDLGGNPDRVIDALGRKTDQTYDGLGRLKKTLQDVDGLAVETRLEYDSFDRLTGVIDPKGLSTVYAYNGFGEQTKLTSPDTGVTEYTYNAAGLLATKKDANDAVAHRYTYDALGRPKAIFYNAAGPADVEYDYDTVNTECTAGQTFALGRLTASRTEGNELKYCYDRFGQVVRKVQIVAGKSFTLKYAYTIGGYLYTATYPDGTTVDYVRDAQARIKEIGVRPYGGTRTVLLNNATYEPFGPVTGWAYGNGRALNRTYDQDYRPKTILDSTSGGLSLGYGYNKVGELTELKDGLQSTSLAGYEYDTLGRLTKTLDGVNPLETYTYDKTGNRKSLLHGGITDAYVYPATSHRLSSVAGIARGYDAAGNTTSVGDTAKEFVYNANGRLSQFKQAEVIKASYRYNAIGERVATTGAATGTVDTYMLYDEDGNWIGDYSSTGAAKQQAVWFDSVPVGLVVGSGGTQTLLYVQPDHLGTPRAAIDPARNVAVWTWDAKSEAFGDSPPNQDPDSDGTSFVLNMRFPGQRYDAVSGLVYNYHRDYDPNIGRYLQTDPLGLDGGINRFVYAESDPLSKIDPFGLQAQASWFVNDSNSPAPRTFYYSAIAYNPPPGVFAIATHGVSNTNYIRGPDQKQISAAGVWNLIKDRYKRGGYKKILILACEAGVPDRNGNSFLSELAKISGEDVEGTRYLVGYPLNGKIFIGDPVPGSVPPKAVPRPGAQWEHYPGSKK